MANANTMREALIAELLGDLDGLTKRIEAVSNTLPDALTDAGARLVKAREALVAAADQSATATRGFDQRAKALETAVDGATRDFRMSVQAFRSTGRTLWFMVPLAVLAGACAGAIAAALVLRAWGV